MNNDLNIYEFKFKDVCVEKPFTIINVLDDTYKKLSDLISFCVAKRKTFIDFKDTIISKFNELKISEVYPEMKDKMNTLCMECVSKWLTENKNKDTYTRSILIDCEKEKMKNKNYDMNNIDNEVFVIKRKLFPMEAMKRERNYESRVMCTVEYRIDNNVKFNVKNVELFRIPCMVNSNVCNLRGLSESDVVKYGGCPLDGGGYFVLGNGLEYVLESQIRNAPNVLQVFNKQNPNTIDTEDDKEDDDNARFTDSNVNKNNNAFVCRISSAFEDQVISYLNEITFEYDKKKDDFVSHVSFPIRRGVRIQESLSDFVILFHEFSGLRIFLSNIIKTKNYEISTFLKNMDQKIEDGFDEKTDKKMDKFRNDEIKDKICNNLFPHLGRDVGPHKTKEFLELMLFRLFATVLKRRPVDQKDHYAFKRVDVAGTLCREIIDKRFNSKLRGVQKKLENFVNGASGGIMNHHKILSFFNFKNELSHDVNYPFLTGNWGSSKKRSIHAYRGIAADG